MSCNARTFHTDNANLGWGRRQRNLDVRQEAGRVELELVLLGFSGEPVGLTIDGRFKLLVALVEPVLLDVSYRAIVAEIGPGKPLSRIVSLLFSRFILRHIRLCNIISSRSEILGVIWEQEEGIQLGANADENIIN